MLGAALQRAYPGTTLPAPTVRIPVGPAHAFLRRMVKTADPAVGLSAGVTLEHGDCGALDYAIQSASNVREALHTLARFMPLINGDLVVELGMDGTRAWVNLRSSLEHPTAEDLLMAGLYRVHMSRLLPFEGALTVYFRQPSPTHGMHREVFAAAQLRFGETRCGFEFDRSALDRLLPTADPKLFRILERQLERDLLEHVEAPTYAELLQRLWARESPMRSTTLGSAATVLGLSARTLSRRLMAEGVTFGAILDRVRHERALACLEKPHVAIPEIARELGFSKASAFQRAFRRWTGEAPSSARRRRP